MATLTDTGPLFVLIDKGQEQHTQCADAVRNLSPPLITTWPCIVEAMYLLGSRTGWKGQEALWNLLFSKAVVLHSFSEDEIGRMRILMNKYRDIPMSLADASLVVTAESLSLKRIFSLDGDFRVYRWCDTERFEVVP